MTSPTEIRIDVAADPARVFRALTSAIELEAWFAEFADVGLEGGRFDFWGRYTPGTPAADAGRHGITACRANESLAFDWAVNGIATRVSFALAQLGDATSVTLRHELLPQPGESSGGQFPDFWCLALQNLRSHIEDGVVAFRPDFTVHPRGEIRLELDVSASPETLFDALTSPAQLERWMMAENATIEAVPGGAYNLGWQEEWGRPLAILELDPPNRLSYSWADPDIEGTIVTWELERSGGATRITLVHSGFSAAPTGEGYYHGWADFLVRLKWLAEKGPSWRAPDVISTLP
jgi:uncharacterized protein YndB with AHSA1/START domain